jgi:diguanylate cyclase (GGDEF)-like protein
MPPDLSPTDKIRDPILNGRDTLRQVKLRLSLTLVMVALLPVVAIAPLVRTIAEEARGAHHQQLESEAGQAAASIRVELDGIVRDGQALAAAREVQAAATAKASSDVRSRAAARLADLVGRDAHAVTGVVLVDAAGALRASAGAGVDQSAYLAWSPDVAMRAASEHDGAPVLFVAIPSTTGTKVTVIATVAVRTLLSWAAPAATMPGAAVAIVDAGGQTVAADQPALDAGAVPGQVLDYITEASHDTVGASPLAVPALADWRVTVRAPIPLAAFPGFALWALLGAVALLGILTTWMAGRIIRPAAELESSRSKLRDLYEHAKEAATRDSLTGLGNHRSYQETLAALVEANRRYGTSFALITLDVDEFKRINDTRGHAIGDNLLSEVGRLIRGLTRSTDSGYRIGGDEFAILLPHADAQAGRAVAARLLRRGLEGHGKTAYTEPISFSIGVTACPEYGTSRVELTAQADAALYRSKHGGRTLVSVYDPARDRSRVEEGLRAQLGSSIGSVIERNDLRPVYQPIVDLSTGAVLGFEALVRLPPDSGFPDPGALFDSAEAAGRVHEVDRLALETVLRGARDMPASMLLSLNVSPRTFETPEFTAATLLTILKRHQIPPERIIVELTERAVITDPVRIGTAIGALQRAGCRVAADDVGAGNAGLKLLTHYRFDVVKIDMSLVRGIAPNDQSRQVIQSIVQLADSWGALSIGEGIETAEQLRALRGLGVQSGQGYLLGRPLPEHSLTHVDVDTLAGETLDRPQLTVDSPRLRAVSGGGYVANQLAAVPPSERMERRAAAKTSYASKE